MNLRFLSACLSLLPLPLLATGFESPARWITDGVVKDEEMPALAAPAFYFELEMRRLAAELHPAAKAVLPNKEEGDPYSQQTERADLDDFQTALQTKYINPPDVAGAINANTAAREFGNDTSATEFPSEFADYHFGAWHYRLKNYDEARQAWLKVLARPESERRYRTTWAAYMLGQLAIVEEEWDDAPPFFLRVRAAAEAGFPDSTGLAAASLGWEAYARLQQKRYGEAAQLYLEQLAAGDDSAISSLKTVLSEAFKDAFAEGYNPAPLAADPVLRRLGIAAAVAEAGPFYTWGDGSEQNSIAGLRWLQELEKLKLKDVRDADRLGWIAYAAGDFAKAARWLARADQTQPYALWLKAKLALRAGELNVAAKLLALAVPKMPIAPDLVSRASVSASELPPDESLQADLAVVRLGRGEYLAAWKLFRAAGLEEDALYLTDAILTIKEVATLIQTECPPKANVAVAEAQADSWHYHSDLAESTRLAFGHRLVRAGRYAEARPYLYEEKQAKLDGFVAHLEAAKKAAAAKDRHAQSEALWEAAQALHDSEGLADYYDPVTIARRKSGRLIDPGSFPEIHITYGKAEPIRPGVSADEKARLARHTRPELRRYYTRYLAADFGWQSAVLMPDNDDATAKRLNTLGNWLRDADDDAADRFYQALERRCAKTALGQAAIKRHWFVPEE